jgi:7tm Odorant receptor
MFIGATFASLIQVFVIFFCSDQLRQDSTNIAEGAYENDWFERDKQTKQALQLIIMRAQRPQHLKAFLFGKITLVAFSALLKASHSYYGLLDATSK